MTAEFFSYYLKAVTKRKNFLAVINPNKFRTCQYLIKYHERRNDKVREGHTKKENLASRLYGSYAICSDNRLRRQHLLVEGVRDAAEEALPLRRYQSGRAATSPEQFPTQPECEHHIRLQGRHRRCGAVSHSLSILPVFRSPTRRSTFPRPTSSYRSPRTAVPGGRRLNDLGGYSARRRPPLMPSMPSSIR